MGSDGKVRCVSCGICTYRFGGDVNSRCGRSVKVLVIPLWKCCRHIRILSESIVSFCRLTVLFIWNDNAEKLHMEIISHVELFLCKQRLFRFRLWHLVHVCRFRIKFL